MGDAVYSCRPPVRYFQLSDAIAAATTPDQLLSLRNQLDAIEMHQLERRALMRMLRLRAELIQRPDAWSHKPAIAPDSDA